MARRLTSSDVCNVTGYTRYQLKALLKQLGASFSAQSERVAREFTPQEMILLGVVWALDIRIGIRRKQIGQMLAKLRKALFVPRDVDPSPALAISFDPLHIEYVTGKISIREGMVISLGPIIDRVDTYLGVAKGRNMAQETLRLPPGAVRARRRRVG